MRIIKLTSFTTTLLLLLSFSTQAQTRSPEDGEVGNGWYDNTYFGFGFKYPKDWVVPDEAVSDRIRERIKEQAGSVPQLKHTYSLFAVTRHPRGTPGIKLNPALVVIAERLAGLGNPTAKEYLLSLRPGQMKKGVRPVTKEPLTLTIGGFHFVRDDYSGTLNGLSVNQAIFVTVNKGYAIAFSLVGEDQKTVEEMAAAVKTLLPLGTGGGVQSKQPN